MSTVSRMQFALLYIRVYFPREWSRQAISATRSRYKRRWNRITCCRRLFPQVLEAPPSTRIIVAPSSPPQPRACLCYYREIVRPETAFTYEDIAAQRSAGRGRVIVTRYDAISSSFLYHFSPPSQRWSTSPLYGIRVDRDTRKLHDITTRIETA